MLLYHRPTSGRSYKVRLLLAILKVDFDESQIFDKNGKDDVEDSYFDPNHRGQIPTLNDDGLVLWGSKATLVYLASKHDRERARPPEVPAGMAAVMQRMGMAQDEINGMFLSRATQNFGYVGNLEVAQIAENKALDVLKKHLNHSRWLAAEQPTIGDIARLPYVVVTCGNGFDLASRPALGRWLDRMVAQDGLLVIPGMEWLVADKTMVNSP